jgi:hypothetical protein
MKKIRLTESQLIDLIKKSVNKVKTINESRIINEVSYISPESLANLAKMLKKNMEGSGAFGNVTSDSLKKAYHNISQMQDWVWQDDGTCAVDKLLAYYKTYNGGTDFLKTLNGATESNDPEFDDLKAKIPKLITKLQQSCAAAKQKDVNDASAKAVALSSCASKEPGYVDQGNNFGLSFGKKGYIIGHKDGSKTNDHNLWYWEYAKFHPVKKGQEAKDVAIARTNGRCVNGVLDIDAWVKY